MGRAPVPEPEQVSASEIARFLRANRDRIVGRWHQAVRDRPAVRGLTVERLIDHIPDLVDAIADTGEARLDDPRARLSPETAEKHAVERSMEGLDLSQVVVELAVLRDCILEVWDRHGTPGSARPEVRFLNRSIDRAITASIDRYVASRDRTLRALDRISTAALESRRLEDLLERLMAVLLDTIPAVDTGAVYLREGDDLVLRTAVGLEGEATPAARVRIGEGFVGRIAAERRECRLSGDGAPLGGIEPPPVRGKALRCLYGRPLADDGQVVGVAYVGSLTAPDLSEQDQLLFQAMVTRASTAIVHHQLREAAERKAAELSAVLESIPDAVLVGDNRGISTANSAALALLGTDTVEEINAQAETIGSRFQTRHFPTGEEAPREARPYARALKGEQARDELIVRNLKTGDELVLRVAAAPIHVGGRVTGAVMVASDVTAERSHEEERKLLYEKARQAVADREHALAVVSHDLRNPLHAIATAAGILAEAGTDRVLVEKAAERVRRSVSRMNRLISDLLDFSSIQAGRLSCSPAPVDAASVVAEALESIRGEAESRGLALRMEAASVMVRADRDRLLQALGNILGNAVKATSEGSISVSVSEAEGEVVFAVLDTGPGIREEMAAHIFEPYWRGKDPAYKGTGLGLAITKAIVEAHRGRVWLERPAGGGTAFCFAIPRADR